MNHDNDGLLAWQLAGYAPVHGDRRNLLVHVLSVPLFILGNCAVIAAPITSAWLALGGVLLTVAAIGLQGRGHRFESGRPAPFTGPFNAIVRIVAEQWITFPGFVLSGGFSRAWRRAPSGAVSDSDQRLPATPTAGEPNAPR